MVIMHRKNLMQYLNNILFYFCCVIKINANICYINVSLFNMEKNVQTRTHSSRMRTVFSSSRLLGVSAGRCLPGGCLPREVCFIPVCTGAGTLLWTEWLTDRCENITFPQLRLRTIKKLNYARLTPIIANNGISDKDWWSLVFAWDWF